MMGLYLCTHKKELVAKYAQNELISGCYKQIPYKKIKNDTWFVVL